MHLVDGVTDFGDVTRLTFPLTKRMQHGHAVLIHATITRIKGWNDSDTHDMTR